MNDDDHTAEDLISVYRTIFETLIEAIGNEDAAEVFKWGEKYVRFLTAYEDRLGVDLSAEIQSTIKRIEPFSAAAGEMKARRIAAQREADEAMQKFGKTILWRRLRQLSSIPPLLRNTAQHRAALRELAPALDFYARYFDLVPIESVLRHFRARLDFYEKMRADGDRFALPAEKLNVLAEALDEFQSIYETEKTGRGELLLSAHEAKRIRKLFDEVDQSVAAPGTHSGN